MPIGTAILWTYDLLSTVFSEWHTGSSERRNDGPSCYGCPSESSKVIITSFNTDDVIRQDPKQCSQECRKSVTAVGTLINSCLRKWFGIKHWSSPSCFQEKIIWRWNYSLKLGRSLQECQQGGTKRDRVATKTSHLVFRWCQERAFPLADLMEHREEAGLLINMTFQESLVQQGNRSGCLKLLTVAQIGLWS